MLQINSFERSYPFWAKTNVFFLDLLDENTININEADNNTFSRIFKMLFNLLSRENPYGHVYKVVGGFTTKKQNLPIFFCNPDNEQQFVEITNDRRTNHY